MISDEVVHTLQELLNICKDYDTDELKKVAHIVGNLIYKQDAIKNEYETNTGAFFKNTKIKNRYWYYSMI